MTKLTFKNPLSEVSMFGGGNYPIRLTKLEGLEFVSKSYVSVKYSGTDGINTISQTHNERIISGNGDIFLFSEQEVNKILNVFAEPGTLFVTKNGITRKINYKPGEFDIARKNGHCFVFTFQVICDNPCFEGMYPHSVNIYERRNKVSGNVTLPCVFTERFTCVTVLNKGQKKAEPVISVVFLEDAEGVENNGFIIKNISTGQRLKFLSTVKEHKTVTVDIANRKVVSESGEDLLKYLSDDSYLSDFCMEAGVNRFEFENLNKSENLLANISYTPLYLGVL